MEFKFKRTPGTAVSADNLNLLLSSLTTDQLFRLIEANKNNFYAFPGKSSVFEVSGVTRKKSVFTVHFSDSTLGISHEQLTIKQLDTKMINDLVNSVDKIL